MRGKGKGVSKRGKGKGISKRGKGSLPVFLKVDDSLLVILISIKGYLNIRHFYPS